MQTYSEFRPTGFDPAGAFLDEDRQGWLVVPVSQTRDSEAIDQSNFAQALEMLGGESETVEVHRFGHWGPGWFEIIIVAPGSAAAVIAEEIEAALAGYPVLNEEDLSRREWEQSEEDWNNWARKDFLDILRDWFMDDDGAPMRFLEDTVSSEDLRKFCDEHSSEYVPINLRSFHGTRSDLAQFIRAQRVQHNPRIGYRDPAQGCLFS